MRLPRGLLEDLETTIIKQDRQWLTEIAHKLQLPPGEVIRRCLGTSGVPTAMCQLWYPAIADLSDEPDACPWWECHGDKMWRRCPRARISPTLPCLVHERTQSSVSARIHTDPVITGLSWLQPVIHGGQLYWWDPIEKVSRNEAGYIEPEIEFVHISVDDTRIWLKK